MELFYSFVLVTRYELSMRPRFKRGNNAARRDGGGLLDIGGNWVPPQK